MIDTQQFKKNYNELMNAFKEIYNNFNIAYSYKTNYTPKLCKVVNELGGYAEVVSDMRIRGCFSKLVYLRKKLYGIVTIKNKDKVRKYYYLVGLLIYDKLYEIDDVRGIVEMFPNHQFHRNSL